MFWMVGAASHVSCAFRSVGFIDSTRRSGWWIKRQSCVGEVRMMDVGFEKNKSLQKLAAIAIKLRCRRRSFVVCYGNTFVT